MSKSGVAFDTRVGDVQFDGCTMAVKSVTVMTVNDEAGGSAFTIVNTNNDVDKVALNNLDVRQVAVKIPESTPPVTSGVMISMHTLNNQDLVHSHSETRSYSTVSIKRLRKRYGSLFNSDLFHGQRHGKPDRTCV